MVEAQVLESVDAVVDSLLDDLSVKKPDRRKPRSWKWMDTVEKAREYCDEHYPGLTRGQVANADAALYRAIHRRGWLDDVFLPSIPANCRDWSGFYAKKSKEYYEANYAGLARGQVSRVDGGFYNMVNKNGWQDEVFPPSKLSDFSSIDTEEKAQQYYAEHLSGMSRSQISENDRGFYCLVLRKGWQDKVFPEILRVGERNWAGKDAEHAKKYYEENYPGMSRTQVARQDVTFYVIVCRNGWLDEVFPENLNSNHRDWSDTDLEGAKEFYDNNYSGMTRTLVQNKDSGFHTFVRRNGWLDDVFPPSLNLTDFTEVWMGAELIDFIGFYARHYAGLTRTQIRKVEGGNVFYNAVRRAGYMDEVFCKPSFQSRRKQHDQA